MVSLSNLDPTAGERARALQEGRLAWPPITDPTAGERARLIGHPAERLVVTDPTDPRYGQPLGPLEELAS
jgi:hypothetical protein